MDRWEKIREAEDDKKFADTGGELNKQKNPFKKSFELDISTIGFMFFFEWVLHEPPKTQMDEGKYAIHKPIILQLSSVRVLTDTGGTFKQQF